jgi:hypothetical protein
MTMSDARIARTARLAGFFYLLTFLTGVPLVFVRKLIVPGNGAATAAGILAHEGLFFFGFASQLVVIACYLAVTALFYRLFEPAGRTLSLTAAFFSLTGCAVQASASLFYLAPLAVLAPPPSLSVFSPPQLQALALLSFKLATQAYNIGIVFFGFYCLLIGCLIVRSAFLPRLLGVLMAIGGVSWLTFLSPSLAASLAPWNLPPGILVEGSLTLWLLFAGVNVNRWREQALNNEQ